VSLIPSAGRSRSQTPSVGGPVSRRCGLAGPITTASAPRRAGRRLSAWSGRCPG